MQSEIKSVQDFPATIRESIEKIAQHEQFESFEVKVTVIPTEGGSYSGDLFAVDIVEKVPNKNKEVNLFVKKVRAVSQNSKDTSVNERYQKEALVYNELFKIFNEFQDRAKIPEEERFKTVKGYAESSNEVLFLENLSKKGYRTGFRMDLISFEFAKLSFEQLAKFHALSFVLQRRRVEYFRKNIQPLKSLKTWSDMWVKILTNLMTSNARNLENAELRKKAEDFVPLGLEKFRKYHLLEEAPVQVLCHGDFRMNNILMKEMEGKVTEVIPVDYQTIYFGCPIHDIVYLIYTSTDRKFREKYLVELIDHYYNTMENFLLHFDLDLKEIMPRNVFDKMYEERRDIGLINAMMIMGFILVNDQDILDSTKQKLENWKPSMHESFQERFGDIVMEFL